MSVTTIDTNQPQGWVLLLVENERHYFIGKSSICLLFVPAISVSDYEERKDGHIPNCWMCEEGLKFLDA